MQILKTFRSYFLRGIAALLPTILTVWLFVQFYRFIQKNVSVHINNFIVQLAQWLGSDATKESLQEFWVTGRGQIAGLIITLILVCFIGAILASVVGRQIWKAVENALMNIPLVSRVYPYVKQLTDAVFVKENNIAFKRVVAVEYPRREAWSIGFVTGTGLRRVVQTLGEESMITIFIPSSPMPFTGYVIMVPEKDTIALDITIEEALRFTVSGGVLTPTRWRSMNTEQTDDAPKSLNK